MTFSPATLTLSCREKIRIKQLHIRSPMLCLIRSGTKHIYSAEIQRTSCLQDNLLLFQKGCVLDIINEPLMDRAYQATMITLSDEYLKKFHDRHQKTLQNMPTCPNPAYLFDKVNLKEHPVLKETFLRTVDTMNQVQNQSIELNLAIYEHRLDELLLILANLGKNLYIQKNLSLSQKIFQKIGHQLHMAWDKKAVASLLNISVSTLERQLKAEQTSFRTLLNEFRMELAMSLLLQGHLTVGQVAEACGYQSHSRFSHAFQKRYQLLPSKVI